MKTSCTFQDNVVVIDRIILKGSCIVILESSQRQASEQLHVNHMVIEKTRLLAHKLIDWTGMKNDI